MRAIKLIQLACVATIALAGATIAWAQDDTQMLDQVTLSDGRQFTGNILEETAEFIKIEIHHLGMKTVQTWRMDSVLEIKHDVIAADNIPARADMKTATKDKREGTGVPVYVVALEGTVGLDSHKRIIQRQWDAAVERGAEVIVLLWDCEEQFPPTTADLEEYRDFFQDLKIEARDEEIQVVTWVKRASGIAIAYALMFEDIYFQPEGKMGGGWEINEALTDMFSDDAVRAKMISAWVGILRGMAEEGGHSANLCEAMIRPERLLSMDRTGRRTTFHLDNDHTPILDSNGGDDPEQNTFELDAVHALDYAISRDTARSIDDLMDSLRIREYYRVDEDAEDLVEGWKTGWQDARQEVAEIRADMQEIDSYDEPIERKIAKKIAKLRDIQALLKKWPPLNVFFNAEDIYYEIDTFKKTLRNIKEGQRGTSNSGGSGRGRGKPDN